MKETHQERQRFNARFLRAWLLLSAAFAIHVGDEAASGFLDLWNPTVLAIRQRHPWIIVPAFTFPVWISLLALAVLGFLILSKWVHRGPRWTIFASYLYIALMLSNAAAHLGFSIYKQQWMPGACTSPLLIAAALYLWWVIENAPTARRSPYSS